MEPTLKDEIQALKNRYLTIHTVFVVMTVLTLVAVGYGIHRTIVGYESKLATAKQMEDTYKKDAQAANEALKAETEKRKQIEEHQKVITHTIIVREKATADRVKVVTAPKKVQQVADDFRDAYNVEPTVQGEKILLDAPSTQIATAAKVERDALAQDKNDLQSLLLAEQAKSVSFAQDAIGLKTTLAECNKTVDKYKDVAGATKKAKIVAFLKTSLIVGGVGLAAYEVGKHSH